MSEQQESMKKKTLKSSSRSFLFSTGLYLVVFITTFVPLNEFRTNFAALYHSDLNMSVLKLLDQLD